MVRTISSTSLEATQSGTRPRQRTLEQRALALHDRHAGNRTDIAQTEHRGAVRDDRNQIVAARIGVAERRIVLDLEARLGNTRRVRDRQIVLAVYLTAATTSILPPHFSCACSARSLTSMFCSSVIVLVPFDGKSFLSYLIIQSRNAFVKG